MDIEQNTAFVDYPFLQDDIYFHLNRTPTNWHKIGECYDVHIFRTNPLMYAVMRVSQIQ